jgi:hypothetical protein
MISKAEVWLISCVYANCPVEHQLYIKAYSTRIRELTLDKKLPLGSIQRSISLGISTVAEVLCPPRAHYGGFSRISLVCWELFSCYDVLEENEEGY